MREILSEYKLESIRQDLAWSISQQTKFYRYKDDYTYTFCCNQDCDYNLEFVEYVPEVSESTADASR